MKRTIQMPRLAAVVCALCASVGSPARAQEVFKPDLPPQPHVGETICTRADEFNWKADKPDLGDKSPQTVILREDPKSGASELMVRLPAGFRLPKHWHAANQTHTVISGTYVMAADGKEPVELPAGSFNYTPARLVHEGWVKGDEPAVLFITFDGKRDNRTLDQDGHPKMAPPEEEFLCVTSAQVQWQKFDPAMPAEFAILHEHPRTKATQLLIRCPADYYVPRHWHSANETHTVLSGSCGFNCGGKRVELNTGSYNYIPKALVHNARMGAAGCTVLITVDGAWDVHWVEPPTTNAPPDANDPMASPAAGPKPGAAPEKK
jgi:quercetin dioxygenase-like cupin family protein